MYDFKREGFPGFPLGQKIEFYGRKLPDSRMVVPQELVAQLRERGIAAEVDSVTVELPELNISFFFFEDVPRTISWQTPEAF